MSKEMAMLKRKSKVLVKMLLSIKEGDLILVKLLREKREINKLLHL